MQRTLLSLLALGLVSTPLATADDPPPLAGTAPLDWHGDLARRMVEGVDRFLLNKIDQSVSRRNARARPDTSSSESFTRSLEPERAHLARQLGVQDALAERPRFERLGEQDERPARLAESDTLHVDAVRWPAFREVQGEGVLVSRGDGAYRALVVLVADADTPAEALCGGLSGTSGASDLALRLAQAGCRVLVVSLVDRTVEPRQGRTALTSREYLHRPAFELGRTLRGYEIELTLSGARALVNKPRRQDASASLPLGIIGYGEGGLIALEAAALAPEFHAALVSGAFDSRHDIWKEPLDRNVFGLLEHFGGAELARLVAPRPLIIEASAWPQVVVPPGTGAAPGRLATPSLAAVESEVRRARDLLAGLEPAPTLTLITSGDQGTGPPLTYPAVDAFLNQLVPGPGASVAQPTPAITWRIDNDALNQRIRERSARLLSTIDRHTQTLLDESAGTRARFLNKLDTSTPENYARTSDEYRRIFANEVIGTFDDPMLPANPRSRPLVSTEKVAAYEVVLDVWPDVFAYGILLIPRDLKADERRPVVVCQHGLEGRPSDVADPRVENGAYNQFGVRLAERGFVVFAPQNLYIGGDAFRTLQRKANPLGKTLFSIIVPQHQQITNWLATLPFVDASRIGFYGLSYGGKTAMRVPPLVPSYCLSICSADFNEWVWKNASTRSPYSYVLSGEYEIFEWNLGGTFNYAEMAALIAPRPFMVERGHFDGVAPDEAVAYEFAKVRNLYEARLRLPADHSQLEWFVGPHTIHGVGTFEFLHHHLKWPSNQPILPLEKP